MQLLKVWKTTLMLSPRVQLQTSAAWHNVCGINFRRECFWRGSKLWIIYVINNLGKGSTEKHFGVWETWLIPEEEFRYLSSWFRFFLFNRWFEISQKVYESLTLNSCNSLNCCVALCSYHCRALSLTNSILNGLWITITTSNPLQS